MVAGVVLVALGALIHVAPWLVTWFGHLPGDIRIETDRARVFIPVTSMIVLSVILTVLLNLFLRR